MSRPHFIHKLFEKQTTGIRKFRGSHSLSGSIGIALALFFIFFPSLSYAVHVTLEWDSNVEPDLAGYIVYYGTQSRDYNYDVDVGDYNSVTISGLAEDVMYYFAVTAYDVEGNESGFSAEVTYPVTSSYTSSYSASGSSGGGGSGTNGSCFISTVSEISTSKARNDNVKKFAMITLVISLLLAALLPRCVPIPRTRQQ